MLQIDCFAYSNRLAPVHPAEKICFALATMLVCLAFQSPAASLGAVIIMAGITVIGAEIPFVSYLRLLAAPAFFLGMATVTVAFSLSFSNGGFLMGFQVGSLFVGITQKGLDSAIIIFLKSLGATTSLFFLSLTTPMVEIVSVLRKARVPSLFVELVALIYRFIFMTMRL